MCVCVRLLNYDIYILLKFFFGVPKFVSSSVLPFRETRGRKWKCVNYYTAKVYV